MRRIGLLGYTNIHSGIGLFIYELNRHLPADSILSIGNPKGPQVQFSDRQITSPRPPTQKTIERWFDLYAPEVVIFIETPFNEVIGKLAADRGIKLVGISMHETGVLTRLGADLFICPSHSAWEKSRGDNNALLFLPIGLELFPFKKRTGHTFVMCLGYDGMRDRRQCAVTLKAFCSFPDPDMRLIVNTQTNIPGRINDPRIEYREVNYPEPKMLYQDGDILLAPMAYGGYERTILEAMASGMPVLTTNADPMNLFQHDRDLLIDPVKKFTFSQSYITNTEYNQVSVNDMRDKIAMLLAMDTEKYSFRARAQAEAQAWECEDIPYRQTWLDTLEGLCSGA